MFCIGDGTVNDSTKMGKMMLFNATADNYIKCLLLSESNMGFSDAYIAF